MNCPIGQYYFFFQAEDGIRDPLVTGVQTCALPIWTAGALPGKYTQTHIPACGACTRRCTGRWKRIDWDRTPAPSSCRSEERRVGKECRSGWWAYHYKEITTVKMRGSISVGLVSINA